MQLSIQDADFLNAFEHLGQFSLDEHNKDVLNLFIMQINANEFNTKYMEELLIDPMIDFSLSRQVRDHYQNKAATLTKKAKEKFVDYLTNKGELGELLLYCFLESHLEAPKILSKLELKTSTSMHVHGSDGVHFLRLKNGDFQLIFGESKTIKDLTNALSDAFKSISEFKRGVNSKGKVKSGLPYEKSLISDHLSKETFSDEEKEFIKQIVYPNNGTGFGVDDAFGIFIGYEIEISDDDRMLPNEEFRNLIKQKVTDEVKGKFNHVLNKITEYKLFGHNFYLYILPFTDLDETRVKVMEGLQK